MSQFVYIPESDIWTDKVRMVQTKDPVLGGKDGPANWAAQDLTNRTLFLKKAVEAAQTSANTANTAAKNADTKAANAQTTANQAKTAATNAQKTADDAKSAAATADGKAVAAQTSANAANTAAKNADTKAGTAQTTANQAKTAAATAQTAADDAKSAAATADSKAVAAQTSANAANTAAKNADTKAANAQTTANQAKTAAANAQKTADDAKSAAATADGKAVAAQTSANTANTAAKNADTKAANAQTTANQAKTAAATADGKAVVAQTKANQVPNPVANNFVVGNTTTAYKLMTVAQVQALLKIGETAVGEIFIFHTKDGVPPAGYIVRNGQAIDKTKMPKLFAEYGATMPDDRNRYYRNQGNLTGTVGTTQEDAIRNIKGSFDATNAWGGSGETGPFTKNGGFTAAGQVAANGRQYFFDASRVVPTTENDTRVKSRIIIACNKIQ